MPRRREAEPLTKVTLNVYSRDYERMQALYAATGAAKAIRALIRNHIQRVDQRAAAVTGEPVVLELDLDDVG